MFIKTEVDGVVGIAIKPFMDRVEREKLVVYLYDNGLKNVALIDLAPSDSIYELIKLLLEAKLNLVMYLDHHESKYKRDELINAQAIYEIIDSHNFRMYPREEIAAATLLVEPGEWKKQGVQVVLFDQDGDGTCGYYKGTSLGRKYSWWDKVALYFERGNGQSLSEDAERFRKLYLDSLNSGPPYRYNPELRNISRQDNYNNFTAWLLGGMDDRLIIDFIQYVDEVTQEANERTQKILENLEVGDGIVFADCYDMMMQGKRPNVNMLKREMFRLAGNNNLVVIRMLGYLGEQISIFKPDKFDLFLPDLLPWQEQKNWHVASRAHIAPKSYPEFIKNYELYREKIMITRGS